MKVARLFDSRSSPREAGCGASSEVMARVDMQPTQAIVAIAVAEAGSQEVFNADIVVYVICV